ncbi:16S rRNA (cytidine(1402)-2'-O)-methyltransferase [bacterium]|nr:16S rRNA (cytidine(1402)-2'-O)-methyltransferase [bacterium]
MKEYDFYIVPTPIGNLKDITLRAIEILKQVDIIACEDMRVTQKLLNHFEIKTKCISYHKFNEKERLNKFVELLNEGKKIALVSDAGTPLFCDPGSILVEELRKHNFSITALAGANAVATFLSQNAREGEDFYFAGFLPKSKSQIEEILNQYKSTNIVFYESPNRLQNTLEIIKDCRNNPKVSVGRELTKVFEEIVTDSAENVIDHFKTNVLKGEIVAMVYADTINISEANLNEKIEKLKKKNFSAKDISIILSELFNVSKNEVYKKAL